jgi:tripartite-type tricarboxylate transporter receptor subunit TctC
MKLLVLALFLFMSNAAVSAKETINVYSKYNQSDVGTRQINGIISYLNNNSKKYSFRMNLVPGAFGEASIRKAIADARVGSKSILVTTVDTMTILKELETSDQKFIYDKHKDLIPLQGISSSSHGLVSSLPVKNLEELVHYLQNEKEFFYGYTSNAVVPKLSADAFIKYYGLNNGKVILYKSQADLQFAVLNKEITFAVGSITEAIGEDNIKLLLSTSKTRSRFFPDVPNGLEKGIMNFKYDAQLFVLVPKEFAEFGAELMPMLKAACESEEYAKHLISLKRNQNCLSKQQLQEFIDEEYKWYLDNK